MASVIPSRVRVIMLSISDGQTKIQCKAQQCPFGQVWLRGKNVYTPLKALCNEHNSLTENKCFQPNKQCQEVLLLNFDSLLTKKNININKVSLHNVLTN